MGKRKRTEEEAVPALAERLTELYSEMDITQQELAETLGRTRQMIGYYADGTSQPSLATLIQICKLFGVSSDWLLGLSDNRSLEPDAQVAQAYTGLSAGALSVLAGSGRDDHRLYDLTLKDFQKIVSELLESSDFRFLCKQLQEYKRLYWVSLKIEDNAVQNQILEEDYYLAIGNELDDIGLGGIAIREVCRVYWTYLYDDLLGILRDINSKLRKQFIRERESEKKRAAPRRTSRGAEDDAAKE